MFLYLLSFLLNGPKLYQTVIYVVNVYNCAHKHENISSKHENISSKHEKKRKLPSMAQITNKTFSFNFKTV